MEKFEPGINFEKTGLLPTGELLRINSFILFVDLYVGYQEGYAGIEEPQP